MNKFLFILNLVFITTICDAQETNSTVKVTVGSKEVVAESGEVTAILDYCKWTLKSDFIAMASGEYPIIFERKIARRFGIEGSAGITHPLFYSEWAALAIKNREIKIQRPDDYTNGSCYRGAIKYYLFENGCAIDSWSIGIQYFNKKIYGKYNSSTEQYSENKTGTTFRVSNQKIRGYGTSSVVFESFLGIGYATTDFKFHNDGSGDYEEYKDKGVMLQFGVCLGFGKKNKI